MKCELCINNITKEIKIKLFYFKIYIGDDRKVAAFVHGTKLMTLIISYEIMYFTGNNQSQQFSPKMTEI